MHEFFENKYLWNAPFLTNDCSSTFQKFPSSLFYEPIYVFTRAYSLYSFIIKFYSLQIQSVVRLSYLLHVNVPNRGEERISISPINFVRRELVGVTVSLMGQISTNSENTESPRLRTRYRCFLSFFTRNGLLELGCIDCGPEGGCNDVSTGPRSTGVTKVHSAFGAKVTGVSSYRRTLSKSVCSYIASFLDYWNVQQRRVRNNSMPPNSEIQRYFGNSRKTAFSK